MASSDDRPDPPRSKLGAIRRNREIRVRHLQAPSPSHSQSKSRSPSPQRHSQAASPSPSRSRSRSVSPQRSTRSHLYEKDAETNLLNFVDFLSEEDVVVEREVPFTDAKQIGLGSTLEVFSVPWKDQESRVAVKRMKRDNIPKRSANLLLEQDTAYLKAVRLFYHDIKSIMQEILVMSREPLSTHRNIVRLLAVSWDDEEEYFTNHLFPPLVVVELAHQETPTLAAYYQRRLGTVSHNTALRFIADIADGLSALHMCGVIHGDLKPENVLLFDDPGEEGFLIAKLSDFGFSSIDFKNESVRGRSEHWDAPESLDGCPENIKADAKNLDWPESVSDVYSFGLVISFIALGGVDPLFHIYLREQSKALNMSEADENLPVNAVKELKFSDGARFTIEEKVRALYSPVGHQNHDDEPVSCREYISLIHDTLQCLPSRRIFSLSLIRQRMIGRDQFARQKKLDRFKVRPFDDAFKSFSAHQSIFTKIKSPFSKRVLAALPPRVKNELLEIVGKTRQFGESQLHDMRRIRLLDMEKETRVKEEQKEIDYENVKLNMDILGRMVSSFQDWVDATATLGVQLWTKPHAELDFSDLEAHLRPQLFTFIDGNNVREARKLLRANPSLAEEALPETGWTPLHLAACEGRTKFIKMLVSEFGADPNVRCLPGGRCTPLHQAVIGRQIEATELLLNLGSNIHAKVSMDEGKQRFTTLELAMQNCLVKDPTKEDLKLISVLLKRGADYLSNFNGWPIIFSAMKHFELLKVFFDCIGPEDSRLVVNYRDAQKETMLHTAVMWAKVDIVEFLLKHGADPAARDISGRTAYVKLLCGTTLQGTVHLAPIQGLMAFAMKKQQNPDDTNKVLSILEQIGGEACAIDDEAFTKEEVEKFLSNFRKYPRFGQVYNPLQVANAQFQMMQYFNSNSPYQTKLTSIREEYLLLELARSLEIWAENRSKGLISSDDLPEHWSEFLEEMNSETGGLLTSWMEPDQIPQITKLLKDSTISVLQWIVEKNGVRILVQLTGIIVEAIITGAGGEFEEHVMSLVTALFKIYQEGFNISWTTKIFGLQRLKQIWRAINRGEILDLLYELAVIVNGESSLDSIDDYTVFQPLRSGAKTPASALEILSLPKKYPGATIFVTTRNFLMPYIRMALFFVQLAIFLHPCLILFAHIYITFKGMRYEHVTTVIWMYVWEGLFPSDWVLFDMDFRLHPNVRRGLQAARELLFFRLWHWFPLEEPLILSYHGTNPMRIDIPTRLDSMHKDGLFPIYWMSLRPQSVATPIPCYAAMGEAMTKWKDGRLPRKAWSDGWWELRGNETKYWKRVNVTERPTWSQYSKASKQIKEILLLKDREGIHVEFLEIRDYYLEPPGQQLIAMDKLFGTEYAECTAIWKALFIDESNESLKPAKKKKRLGWLERLVDDLALDRIRDMVAYTWDKGLLDENGRPLRWVG